MYHKTCKKCLKEFPYRMMIDGILRDIHKRSYCLECSPFGQENNRKLNFTVDTTTYVTPTSELGKNIENLRSQGKSYKKIQDELGCSKSTLAYYCGKGQKEKCLERHRKFRLKPNPIQDIKSKLETFSNRSNSEKVSFEDFMTKFSDVEECSLSGRPVNVNDPSTYELDHIIPLNKGGTGNIENMQLLIPVVNHGKYTLGDDEYIQLCRECLDYAKKPQILQTNFTDTEINYNVKYNQTIYYKLTSFCRNRDNEAKYRKILNYYEFFHKFGCVKNCYLSGRPVDVYNPDTYQLDHIISVSNGGEFTFENMGIVCPSANHAKYNMSISEFFVLCYEVVQHANKKNLTING